MMKGLKMPSEGQLLFQSCKCPAELEQNVDSRKKEPPTHILLVTNLALERYALKSNWREAWHVLVLFTADLASISCAQFKTSSKRWGSLTRPGKSTPGEGLVPRGGCWHSSPFPPWKKRETQRESERALTTYESFHRLREETRIAAPTEAEPRCSDFSTERFDAVWVCLAAGGDEQYISKRILGHMLEDVGCTCEVKHAERGGEAETVEPEPDDEDHSLMQTSGANMKRTSRAREDAVPSSRSTPAEPGDAPQRLKVEGAGRRT